MSIEITTRHLTGALHLSRTVQTPNRMSRLDEQVVIISKHEMTIMHSCEKIMYSIVSQRMIESQSHCNGIYLCIPQMIQRTENLMTGIIADTGQMIIVAIRIAPIQTDTMDRAQMIIPVFIGCVRSRAYNMDEVYMHSAASPIHVHSLMTTAAIALIPMAKDYMKVLTLWMQMYCHADRLCALSHVMWVCVYAHTVLCTKCYRVLHTGASGPDASLFGERTSVEKIFPSETKVLKAASR